LDAAAFRYDGPRPRSKENLIIMMADSIEAASRSLKRITRQTVEDLVNEIFDSKLTDHQLDECPVTINEISKMREEFINVVSSMMHSRISYRDEIVTESLTTS
jgi:membrane-associated HD superfamily phosphohydrolase